MTCMIVATVVEPAGVGSRRRWKQRLSGLWSRWNLGHELGAFCRHSQQEVRMHALGKTDEDRPLHISFTLRQLGQLIRVISARDMHKKERAIYEQAN